MTSPLVICDLYSRTHADILSAAAQLADEELHRTFGQLAPSVAFHAWHVARWADRVYETPCLTFAQTPEEREAVVQTWDEYQLAEKWGLTGTDLGALRHRDGNEQRGRREAEATQEG